MSFQSDLDLFVIVMFETWASENVKKEIATWNSFSRTAQNLIIHQSLMTLHSREDTSSSAKPMLLYLVSSHFSIELTTAHAAITSVVSSQMLLDTIKGKYATAAALFVGSSSSGTATATTATTTTI